MFDEDRIQQDSPAWIAFVQICFAISLGGTALGVIFLPVNLWVKGYLGMGLLFTVGSTIILSKTLRDQHEARKLIKRIRDAKTEKILTEFEKVS